MKTKISENLKDKVNKLQEERIKRVNDRINIKIEKKRINLVKADIEKHLLAIKHRDTEISKTMTNPLVTDASVSRNVINTTSNNNLTTTIDHLNTNSSDNSFAEKSKVLKKSKGINFEKYSPRKNIFYTGNSPPILTYIEPAYSFSKEKIDKTFDLKKMKARYFNFATVNSIPSIGYYKPNYNYLDNHIPSIIPFKKKRNKDNKYMLIQKLWRSYQVSSDYKTVKLNNN